MSELLLALTELPLITRRLQETDRPLAHRLVLIPVHLLAFPRAVPDTLATAAEPELRWEGKSWPRTVP